MAADAAAALTLFKVEALTFRASPIVGILLPDEITLLHTCSRAFMPPERRILLLRGIAPPFGMGSKNVTTPFLFFHI